MQAYVVVKVRLYVLIIFMELFESRLCTYVSELVLTPFAHSFSSVVQRNPRIRTFWIFFFFGVSNDGSTWSMMTASGEKRNFNDKSKQKLLTVAIINTITMVSYWKAAAALVGCLACRQVDSFRPIGSSPALFLTPHQQRTSSSASLLFPQQQQHQQSSNHAGGSASPLTVLFGKKAARKGKSGGKSPRGQQQQQEKKSVQDQRFDAATRQFMFTMVGLTKMLPDKSKNILKNINLSFYPGAKIGVGKSQCNCKLDWICLSLSKKKLSTHYVIVLRRSRFKWQRVR